jgi:hypothetical protein
VCYNRRQKEPGKYSAIHDSNYHYFCLYRDECSYILSLSLSLSLSTALHNFGPWPLLQFLNPIHSRWDSLDEWPVRLKASTQQRTEQTQNKHVYTDQTSMPCVGFELTVPASERAKTVHVLDRSATVIGPQLLPPSLLKEHQNQQIKINYCVEIS